MGLWFLGYPERAEQARRDAWTIIEELNIPACTTFALGYMLHSHRLHRDYAVIVQMACLLYTS